jgi:hypothetical protein
LIQKMNFNKNVHESLIDPEETMEDQQNI